MSKELSPEEKQINADRQAAVRDAWDHERTLVCEGKGTRDWTPWQQEELLTTGRVEGFEGHHMSSVKIDSQNAGNRENIQFLTSEEHLQAHNGNYQNPSNGYYDPETGTMKEFQNGEVVPAKEKELSNRAYSYSEARDMVRSSNADHRVDKLNASLEERTGKLNDRTDISQERKETIQGKMEAQTGRREEKAVRDEYNKVADKSIERYNQQIDEKLAQKKDELDANKVLTQKEKDSIYADLQKEAEEKKADFQKETKEEANQAAQKYIDEKQLHTDTEKNAAEKNAAEKDAAEKNAAEKDAAEKNAAEKDAAEKNAAEKDAAEKNTAEKDAAEKNATEKDTAEKAPEPAENTSGNESGGDGSSGGNGPDDGMEV